MRVPLSLRPTCFSVFLTPFRFLPEQQAPCRTQNEARFRFRSRFDYVIRQIQWRRKNESRVIDRRFDFIWSRFFFRVLFYCIITTFVRHSLLPTNSWLSPLHLDLSASKSNVKKNVRIIAILSFLYCAIVIQIKKNATTDGQMFRDTVNFAMPKNRDRWKSFAVAFSIRFGPYSLSAFCSMFTLRYYSIDRSNGVNWNESLNSVSFRMRLNKLKIYTNMALTAKFHKIKHVRVHNRIFLYRYNRHFRFAIVSIGQNLRKVRSILCIIDMTHFERPFSLIECFIAYIFLIARLDKSPHWRDPFVHIFHVNNNARLTRDVTRESPLFGARMIYRFVIIEFFLRTTFWSIFGVGVSSFRNCLLARVTNFFCVCVFRRSRSASSSVTIYNRFVNYVFALCLNVSLCARDSG